MSPADLAQRLAALDLSGVSLQHRLAVSAAVETLKAIAPITTAESAELFKPGEFKTRIALPVSAEVFAGLGGVIRTDKPNNVVSLPVTRWTRLYHLDGTLWASASHFGPEGAWGWVLETVAAVHGVSEDQISSGESDETQPYDCDDLVTVDGLPVYRVRHTSK